MGVVLCLGMDPPQAELKKMFNDVDKDGSGFIEEEEFIELMAAQMKDTEGKEVLLEAFKVFDSDGCGYITNDDLREEKK